MDLLKLKSNKGARSKKKRLGRGQGSGLGTYAGKGIKGQNARSGGKRRPGFEGGQTTFVQKMPKLRGFRNMSKKEYRVINLDVLEAFEDGAKVDKNSLFEKKLIKSKDLLVKILGNGEIKKKLTIDVDAVSKSAADKITKAGGSVVEKKSAEKETK